MPNKHEKSVAHAGPSPELVENVVRQFVQLLVAGGTCVDAVRTATSKVLLNSADESTVATFTELGPIQRDCMEVLCTWRRDVEFIDRRGNPLALRQGTGEKSFGALCKRASCKSEVSTILGTLLDFGAVSIRGDDRIIPETPTFLLGGAKGGGRLAVDGVLRQLQGFLQVVHRNVCSISGEKKPKFERACTVSIAVELEAIFDELVRARGQEFIDSIDEWLERNAKRESASQRYLELGVGVYSIDLGDKQIRTQKP